MGKVYLTIVISFFILVITNIIFGGLTIYAWITEGIDAILLDEELGSRILDSIYIKWILLADAIWILVAISFAVKRKHYKTNPQFHYLKNNKIEDPKICVILPTYNEEKNISKIISDFKKQENVQEIIVVDNHSTDKTVDIAKEHNITIIEKESNKGYAHSCRLGFLEFLKTDSNIVVLTDSDDTFSADDLSKMIPYLDNCDMVIGTRQVQILTEKGNQNSMFYVWGNLFLAKLLQIKYFSLLHMGVAQLTDVGCSYRCIRRESIEKIKEKIENPKDKSVLDANGWLFTIYLTMLGIENDLKIVEVPITFKKRIGESKSQASKKTKGIVYGLRFMWYILKS